MLGCSELGDFKGYESKVGSLKQEQAGTSRILSPRAHWKSFIQVVTFSNTVSLTSPVQGLYPRKSSMSIIVVKQEPEILSRHAQRMSNLQQYQRYQFRLS